MNMGILIGVFCVVIFMDWYHYRIPNVCIIAGMVAGLIMTCMSYSLNGLWEAVGAAAVIFLAFYPFYLLGTLGAGDVKLFMMVACYRGCMGTGGLLHYLLVTMVIAAVVSVGKMVLYTESRERLFYLMRYLRKVAVTGTADAYQVDRMQKRCVVRLSIPAFLSLLFMCAGMYR